MALMLAIAIALLAALLWAVDASAASVLLVVPPSPSPAMAEAIVRVRGELIAEGFQVQVMDGMPGKDSLAGATAGEGGGHEALEQLAKMRKADAVVAILGDETPEAVEIWVVDKATQKTVMRRIPFQSQPDHGSKTFAIHTLELLRGSLLELDLRPDDQPREDRPTVVATTASESPGPGNPSGRFGVQVGAAGVIGFGDLGPMVLPIVRLGWALSPSVIALLAAAGYGSRASVAFDGASARASEQFALVGACYRFNLASLGRRLRPNVSVAAGMLHTGAEGQSDPLHRGLDASLWSFLLDGGVGLGLVLADRFEVELAAHAQIADPYPALRFDQSVVATANHPSVLITLTMGAWL